MHTTLILLRCAAALSSHAGRNQRALPDKRARRKPSWLDGTVDPKMAAQMTVQQATGFDVRTVKECNFARLLLLAVLSHSLPSVFGLVRLRITL